MAEYGRLAKQLAGVRRAWKRTAALSGLAVTCLETLGVLTVAFIIDWIYRPPQAWRFALLFMVLAAVVALVVRHVVRPLLRPISDDQVALFVEEHNDQFEGSLITATEFAGPAARPQAAAHSDTPAFFIDAVIQSAIQRAGHINLRTILDFRRLRKYGVAAMAVLAGYGVAAVLAPDYVTQHMGRVIAPWKKRAEDPRALDRVEMMKAPITFTLSKGNAGMLRGGSFELEAVLSRHSEDPVSLNFKPAADTAGGWRVVPMGEMDKLNGFKGVLPDVTEDLEFFVSSGSHYSDRCKLSVYDPLAVQTVEARMQYPAYLQLPDKVEIRAENAGIDLAAPEGSKVTLRITANRPILSGQLRTTGAAGGVVQQVPMAPETAGKHVAVASFEVKADGTYEYEIGDVVGQKAASAARGYIRVLSDGPPTMEVRRPITTATPVPIGEVTFQVAAADDLALGGVEVFYERQLPNASKEAGVPVQTRSGKMPLQVKHLSAGAFPDVTEATGRLMLETLDPPCQPEEILSYYVQATDRKGQKVVSEIQSIAVQHYENWTAADTKPPHEPTFLIQKDIQEYVKLAWTVHQAFQKLEGATGVSPVGSRPSALGSTGETPVAPADAQEKVKQELVKQSYDIADSMKDESGRMYGFYNLKKIPADKKHHAHKADEYILSGYNALKAPSSDTGKAVADFRVAAAELMICGIGNMAKTGLFGADFVKPGNQKEKDLKKLFEKIATEVGKRDAPQDYLDKVKKAEELKKAVAELEKKQADIAKKADQLAKQDPADKKPEGTEKKAPTAKDPTAKDPSAKAPTAKDPTAKDPTAKDPNKKDDPEGLAGQQDKIADETRRQADKARNDPKADPTAKVMVSRMEDATRQMKEATRNLREGKLDEAAAAAEQARKELLRVAAGAELMRQDKLAEAISLAEKEAGTILVRQREVTRQTQGVATRPADQQDKEIQRLAFQQAQLKSDAAAVKDTVKSLNDWAAKDAKPETAKQVEESHRQMTRGQVEQKMSNAVVELTGKQTGEAVKEQKKAQDALTKVVDSLRKAGDSMAADTEAELRRAAAEAARIDEGLQKMGLKVPATQPSGPLAQSRPATQQTASKIPNAKDPNAKDPNAKPLTPQEKKDLAESLAYDLDRFASHLENRQFGEKKDREDLKKRTQDPNELTRSLQALGTQGEDNGKSQDLGLLVRRLRNKLEAEYQAQLDAKRLMAAQREECPPAFRPLVNKYYEALSQVKK